MFRRGGWGSVAGQDVGTAPVNVVCPWHYFHGGSWASSGLKASINLPYSGWNHDSYTFCYRTHSHRYQRITSMHLGIYCDCPQHSTPPASCFWFPTAHSKLEVLHLHSSSVSSVVLWFGSRSSALLSFHFLRGGVFW